MSKITLKLMDLVKGDRSFREFDDEAATLAFLRERPRLVDVLGVVFEGLTPEQNLRLKEAMRPLDAEEKAAEATLADASAKALELAHAQRAKEEDAARAAHREAMKSADPNRAMEVRYRYDTGLAVAADDPREISDEVRAAVAAWVAERNEWVEGRGQVVGEAKVTVWPGKRPKPDADLIHGGSFIPVTAAAKPKS